MSSPSYQAAPTTPLELDGRSARRRSTPTVPPARAASHSPEQRKRKRDAVSLLWNEGIALAFGAFLPSVSRVLSCSRLLSLPPLVLFLCLFRV